MASPSNFFDPFYRIQETANLLDSVHLGDEAAPLISISKDGDHTLPIAGQGTVSVSSKAKNLLRFMFQPGNAAKQRLFLDIGTKECQLYESDYDVDSISPSIVDSPENTAIPYEVTFLKKKSDACLRPGVDTTYWVSLDRSNGVIMYGKYYANRSMALMQAEFKCTTEHGVKDWKQKEYEWLGTLTELLVIQDPEDEKPVRYIREFTCAVDLIEFLGSSQNENSSSARCY
jgi:hypothetical protein